MVSFSPISAPTAAPVPLMIARLSRGRPATPHPAARQPLSQQLFSAITSQHQEIAQHAFFGALDDGTLTKAAYVSYLRDHLVICVALEDALRAAASELGALSDLHFERSDAILADLQALGAPAEPAQAAAKVLARRIRVAPANELLVHAWTEYMGMLNGGQGMRPKLHKLFGTAQFLTFTRPYTLRQQYNETVDDRRVAHAERQEMCQEARAAFVLHSRMLDEDMACAPRSWWATLTSWMTGS